MYMYVYIQLFFTITDKRLASEKEPDVVGWKEIGPILQPNVREGKTDKTKYVHWAVKYKRQNCFAFLYLFFILCLLASVDN